MARHAAHSPANVVPLFPQEMLYVGIDVGKFRHVAGFLSRTLLKRHERFEGCPTFVFDQSREGYRAFVDRLRELAPIEHVCILLEHTGHYHRLLEQYLLELDITVYRIHVQSRPKGREKSDKRDALGLANRLYTQLELGAQVEEKMQLVRRAYPPTKAASQLKGLIQHRYELSHQSTQVRNKLTAICDELFPEFTQIFRDPNREWALAYREKFPTPQVLATASMATLQEVRSRNFPSDAQLVKLQRLARETIGTNDADRQRGLLIEQGLLIKELRVVQEHLDILHTTISEVVTKMLFLMVGRAITLECEWARIYRRLLPRLAIYDERTRNYRGKLRVIGRIAGQMATMIFALLKTDYETLSQVPSGQEPPPPMLYDAAIHRRHQEGHYRSLKPDTLPRKIIQLPKKT
jgi:transposase